MSSLLEIQKLDVSYGPVRALQAIDLDIHEGEIVTLVGANGAGKSTLLKTISGILRPREGNVRFRGEIIQKKSPEEITKLGVIHIPERRLILSSMTVMENLFLGSDYYKDSKKKTETLDKVFRLFPILQERKNQLGGTLSGGEQQMLAIGRALMGLPKLLMMDEPSLGLAPLLVREVFLITNELHQQGITILLVEQNAMKALRNSHRGYVLRNGRIVLKGDSQFLLNDEALLKSYIG
jgi:branched-chain amino acid transport system ATP-binding protein